MHHYTHRHGYNLGSYTLHLAIDIEALRHKYDSTQGLKIWVHFLDVTWWLPKLLEKFKKLHVCKYF